MWLEVNGRSKIKAFHLRLPQQIPDRPSRSGSTYITVPLEVLWNRLSNTRALSMLSWQLTLSNADGKPRFVQWKTAAQAFWAITMLLKDLGIQGQAQRQTRRKQRKHLSGSGSKGKTPPGLKGGDLGRQVLRMSPLRRCCGPIIDTRVNQGAHLRTSMTQPVGPVWDSTSPTNIHDWMLVGPVKGFFHLVLKQNWFA